MDLERRQVLVRTRSEYRCKVGLFGDWLVDRGVSEVALPLEERDATRAALQEKERLRVKGQEVCDLVDGWGPYRGISIGDDRLQAWLSQFDTREQQRLMFDVLKAVRFYSGGEIREKLRQGHGFVVRELAARGATRRIDPGARKRTDNILISYYGGEGKRGQGYAKWFADENGIYFDRIVSPQELDRKLEELDDVAGVVFVDDFIGTGGTAIESLRQELSPLTRILTDRRIAVFVVCVVGFASAGEKVERLLGNIYPVRVSIVDPLGDVDRCFSDEAEIFEDARAREDAREAARDYGRRLLKKHPLGHGDCQALVVFEGTCPNNSLPILWSSAAGLEASVPTLTACRDRLPLRLRVGTQWIGCRMSRPSRCASDVHPGEGAPNAALVYTLAIRGSHVEDTEGGCGAVLSQTSSLI